MRLKDRPALRYDRKSTWTGLLLVAVAALTLEATSFIQYHFTKHAVWEASSQRADSYLVTTRDQILDIIDQAELAVRNNVWIASKMLDYPDSLQDISKRIVKENPVVVGSTVALVPGYMRSRPLFAPYFFKVNDTLRFRSLANPTYNYPAQEWFRKPIELGEGYWSEPYVDVGGGDMQMTTFSMPVMDKTGKMAAILTADISLDWLTDLVESEKIFPNSIGVVISREGRIMVSPAQEYIMQKTVDEVVGLMADSLSFREAKNAMLEGKSGNMPVMFRDQQCHIYYTPVERNGWSISVLVPHNDVYGNVRRVEWIVKLFQLIGLAMLILILRSVIMGQNKYRKLDERKQMMEGELHIASGIQMSMVPKEFPPFPERHDLDIAADIVPAKEVGGDFYDFFIRDEKLFFCIGDVSGKGVPASLVMAMTRSVFRTLAANEDTPAKIVKSMNDSLVEMNDKCMFVTFFCAVLDLVNGRLRYCNAGHNPPMILADKATKLPVVSNLPLGILPGFKYAGQEARLRADDAIFLYTDGLTEAENRANEQFGEARVEDALRGSMGSEEHLAQVRKRVEAFVGKAPQSDDLTMLVIRYLGTEKGNHLTLTNDIKQISLLSGFIDRVAEENDLDPGLAMSLNLAIEEAVTNVIMYAYPEGTEGKIDLQASTEGRCLQFILSDSGKSFDPTAVPDADISASLQERHIGGLGIHLVRNIMDSVSYRRNNGKNILTMTKNI